MLLIFTIVCSDGSAEVVAVVVRGCLHLTAAKGSRSIKNKTGQVGVLKKKTPF